MSKVQIPFLRTPFNYDRDAASDESGLSCGEPSRAQQNFRDECDINVIMERFGKTGQVPANVRTPSYDDFTTVTDFQSAMNAVRQASEDFMELPAKLRSRFDNDPQLFLEFVSNDANRSEAVSLGILKPVPAVPEPQLVRVVQDEILLGPHLLLDVMGLGDTVVCLLSMAPCLASSNRGSPAGRRF